MGMAESERRKDEKIDGVVYDMPPAPGFKHGIINGNIYNMIKNGLKNSMCLVFIENLDFKFRPDVNDDYVCPDIMLICDRKHLKGGSYSGVPKLIVETLSPSTAKKDRTEKKEFMRRPAWKNTGLYPRILYRNCEGTEQLPFSFIINL